MLWTFLVELVTTVQLLKLVNVLEWWKCILSASLMARSPTKLEQFHWFGLMNSGFDD